MNKKITALICILSILMLCACQSNPQDNIIISKNDGSFDASIAKENEQPDGGTKTIQISRSDSFRSLDESVEFRFNLNTQITQTSMPVIEVSPHNITSEEAKNIATVLLGTTELFEYDPAEPLTKNELEEKISLWATYLSKDALIDLFGNDLTDGQIERWKNRIQGFLDDYSQKIHTAPENMSQIPCQWTFHPQSHYQFTEEELSLFSLMEKENLEIVASVNIAEIPYRFIVSNRNEDDYKIHNINVFIDGGSSPGNLSDFIIKERICKSSTTPSTEQLNAITDKVTSMLESLKIGSWEIDECYYEPLSFEGNDAYVITVNAVPRFGNLAAVRQEQLSNLKSKENFASNYYFTDASFQFSPDGTLISCSIMSPIDITKTINKSVQTLSFDELNEIAKKDLSLNDYHVYAADVISSTSPTFKCTVEITDIIYGLTRVKAHDSNNYYYVPAITYKGNYQAIAANTNEVWFDSNYWWNGEPQTLLVLNAVDGTVINVSNGY